jgi:hypothetical protein
MGTTLRQPKQGPTDGTTLPEAGRDNPTDRMPPSLTTPRRRIIDVRETWPDLAMLDPRTGKVRRLWRAKALTATVAERVVERQIQRTEETDEDNE